MTRHEYFVFAAGPVLLVFPSCLTCLPLLSCLSSPPWRVACVPHARKQARARAEGGACLECNGAGVGVVGAAQATVPS
jgi:hypothetical protein